MVTTKAIGIAVIAFLMLAAGIYPNGAHGDDIKMVRGEIESMKKDDPEKYRDFQYVLRHIRSINKKQGELTSIFVAKAVADHVHWKKYRFSSDEHRLNFLSVIMGIMRVESGFNPKAVSSKNARGLMQVHWPTWRQYFTSQEEAHNLNRNLSIGTGILRLYMTKSNNNLRMALYKYLGTKDDRYADKVITSAIAFKKSVLMNPIANPGDRAHAQEEKKEQE